MLSLFLLVFLDVFAQLNAQAAVFAEKEESPGRSDNNTTSLDKESYVDGLISNMTIEDLG